MLNESNEVKRDISSSPTYELMMECKSKCYRITGILYRHRKAETLDLLSTSAMSLRVLDCCIQVCDEQSGVPRYLESSQSMFRRLNTTLSSYEALLDKSISAGKFQRYLTSNRTRKNVEEQNAMLLAQIKRLESKLEKIKLKRVVQTVDEMLEKLKNEQSSFTFDLKAVEMWSESFGKGQVRLPSPFSSFD